MKKQDILITDIVKQGDGNIVSDMDGEKVMLSIENSKYYNLGIMGGQIWEMIRQPMSLNQIVRKLLSEYNVGQTM